MYVCWSVDACQNQSVTSAVGEGCLHICMCIHDTGLEANNKTT